MGYLELFPSPWNATRSVLTVLGSNAEGVGWAGTTLVTSELRGQLEGNLAVVDGQQVVVGVQSTSVESEPVAVNTVPNSSQATEETAVVTDSTEQTAVQRPVSSNAATNPDWILPTVGVSTALMGLVLLTLFFNAWRQRRMS